jgi:uridine kinase
VSDDAEEVIDGDMTDVDSQCVAPVIERIRELRLTLDGALVVAIDGYAGSGKSTFADALAAQCHGVVVPVDDFFAGGSAAEWDSRTPAENAALGIDWTRLRSEALAPLRAGQHVEWHPFDWGTREGLARHVEIRHPASVIVLEGAYSTCSELVDLVDLSVLLDVRPEMRFARLIKRDGGIGSWYPRWNAAEQFYFSFLRPPAAFDVVLVNPGPAVRGCND